MTTGTLGAGTFGAGYFGDGTFAGGTPQGVLIRASVVELVCSPVIAELYVVPSVEVPVVLLSVEEAV